MRPSSHFRSFFPLLLTLWHKKLKCSAFKKAFLYSQIFSSMTDCSTQTPGLDSANLEWPEKKKCFLKNFKKKIPAMLPFKLALVELLLDPRGCTIKKHYGFVKYRFTCKLVCLLQLWSSQWKGLTLENTPAYYEICPFSLNCEPVVFYSTGLKQSSSRRNRPTQEIMLYYDSKRKSPAI